MRSCRPLGGAVGVVGERKPGAIALADSAPPGNEVESRWNWSEVRIGKQYNEMTTTTGYASSRLGCAFWPGGRRAGQSIEIQWPSGAKQVLTDVKADRVLQVTEP